MVASVIAWDIETVPDLKGFAAANGLEGKTDEDIRAAMGDKFPKHIYHSIICIDALVAHQEKTTAGVWMCWGAQRRQAIRKGADLVLRRQDCRAETAARHLQWLVVRPAGPALSRHGQWRVRARPGVTVHGS